MNDDKNKKPAEVVESVKTDEELKAEQAAKEAEEKAAKEKADADAAEKAEKEKVEAEAKAKEEAEKEAAAKTTLQKVEDLNKDLDSLTPQKEEATDKLELGKTVNALAGALSKMTSILKGIEGRVATLEKQPAETKSKSAFVYKSDAEKEAAEKAALDKSKGTNSAVAEKEARLLELNKMFDALGANEFAKQGFSQEAMNLEKEIETLKASGK